MKTALLLAATGLLISITTSLLLTSASARHQDPLTADVSCESPETGAFAFDGRIEIDRGTPDDPDSDSAVIYDESGGEHPTRGFGLTGETMIIVSGRDPITTGIELGEARHLDVLEKDLVQCFISGVVSEVRELTDEDVVELNVDPALVGTTAEIETSVHGIAWVVLLPPV